MDVVLVVAAVVVEVVLWLAALLGTLNLILTSCYG